MTNTFTDVDVVTEILFLEDLGWKIANISQCDTGEWYVEAREGHITSYSGVIITGREAGILPALREASRQAAGWKELRDRARELGIKGKITFV